jgi:hypothetical protein
MKPMGVAALLIGFILIAGSVRAQSMPSLNLEGTGDLGPGPGACVAAGCSGLFSAIISGQLAQAVNQAALQINLQVASRFVCGCGPSVIPCPLIPCPAPAASPANPAPSPVNPRRAKAGGGRQNLEAQIVALQQQTQQLQQQVNTIIGGLPLSPGCYAATGSGTFSGTQYTVNFTGQLCSDNANNLVLSGPVSIVQSSLSAGLVTWAAGTLVASGTIHIPVSPTGNPIPISGPMVVSIVGAVGEIPGLVP